MFPGRIDPMASRPSQPRPAPPFRRASPRPERPIVCPGFESRQVQLELAQVDVDHDEVRS